MPFLKNESRTGTVDKIFIANRGEIACRIASTAHRMGIQTCGVYTPQDDRTKHVRVVQKLTKLPAGDLPENYLNQDLLIRVAKDFEANAVHPGYGFLSENPDFAQKVIDAGLIWIGPPPRAMRMLGGKIEAKEIAEKAGVPVPRWTTLQKDPDPEAIIREFGLPLLIKAAHGGGGRGQRIVREPEQFEEALRAARSESQRSFGSSEVFLERFLDQPRHIEAQILADQQGHVFVLGERDCTLQRRNQKLVEETPATVIDKKTRHQIHQAAHALATAVGYTNAGTIEFLAQQTGKGKWEFFFMELNARLQVEHPVTEMVTGLDLVEMQIRSASGEDLSPLLKDISFEGHAMEVRLCAEDPAKNFLPTPGPLIALQFPENVRIDSGYEPGDVIPQEYDSLFAKVIVHAKSRDESIQRVTQALQESLIAGTITNKFYLERVLQSPDFQKNRIHTRWMESHPELMEEDNASLDEDLLFWAKRFSSELLVQRNPHGLHSEVPARVLKDFFPDFSIHGARASKGVSVGGHFLLDGEQQVYAAGWVNRFELCITFQRVVEGVAQRRLSFAGQYEIEDLRTHHGPITAQVPGVVLEVRAETDDIVEALQPILIVEAMKIEMPFSLPISAKITKIHVKPGDRILPGQTLVTWEPAA